MKLSYKKTLGALGTIIFYAICIIAVVKDPVQTGVILSPLMILIGLLFGIKTAGGVAIAKIKEDHHK